MERIIDRELSQLMYEPIESLLTKMGVKNVMRVPDVLAICPDKGARTPTIALVPAG